MNKQLTKKTIGIAASAALMAAALSATAVAGPDNPKKGPKASIDVAAWCDVTVDAYGTAWLEVNTLVLDKGDDVNAMLIVADNSIMPVQGVGDNRKGGPGKFSDLPAGEVEMVPSIIGEIQGDQPIDFETTHINLCDAGLDPAANTTNALVTVEIVGGHKTFTSMCGDYDFDGDGYLDVTSDTEIGHLEKCN